MAKAKADSNKTGPQNGRHHKQKTGDFCPIFVIAGRNPPFVNETCRNLINRLLPLQQRPMGLFDAEAASVSAAEVLDELRTLPFLTEKRVVLVRDADNFISANRVLLEKYFDNPCGTGILILTVKNWDSRTRLAKKLKNVGRLISLADPRPHELPHLLIRYVRDTCRKILTRPAAELLIDLAGDSLPQLHAELDKLALFVYDKKAIELADVELLIGHNRFFNAFNVIDAVMTGRLADAVSRLRSMFAADKSSRYSAVGAFAFHFRRMFNAKVMTRQGANDAEIADRLRIWGNRNAFFSHVHSMSLQQIGDRLKQLTDIDYEIKTGRTQPEVAIEQFVLGLVKARVSKS